MLAVALAVWLMFQDGQFRLVDGTEETYVGEVYCLLLVAEGVGEQLSADFCVENFKVEDAVVRQRLTQLPDQVEHFLCVRSRPDNGAFLRIPLKLGHAFSIAPLNAHHLDDYDIVTTKDLLHRKDVSKCLVARGSRCHGSLDDRR